MSLSSLINNADCGPSNALQSLTKRVDADRGIQQDFFGPGRAGPSNAGFRTATQANLALNAEKIDFFNGPGRPMAQAGPTQPAFDLSSMRRALDMPQHGIARPGGSLMVQEFNSAMVSKGDVANWAADFMMEGASNSQRLQSPVISRGVTPQPLAPGFMPMNHLMRPDPSMMHMYPMPQHSAIPRPAMASTSTAVNWEEEFLQQSHSLETNTGKTVNDPVLVDSDELSRTAGLLIESLKSEENPKFQNSAFMGFMRQIRDKEMVVDGDKIVASSEATVTANAAPPATRTASSTLGVGSNAIAVPRERSMTMDGWPMKSVHFDPVTTTDEPTVEASQGESEEDAYWKAENRDYREYWEKAASLSSTIDLPSRLTATLQQREWGALQESWDAWEATETGVRHAAAANYPFQTNNPYVFDSRSGTRGTQSSNEFEQSVLEREAAVLNDPQNPEAWYNLGVKQQANEREGKAIQALQKAVELDPSMLSGWMELAVSYTNDGNKTEAYSAMSEWVERNPKYTDAVARWKRSQGHSFPLTVEGLIDCLVTMARSVPDGELDADVQIALGVLLNTTEEYDKARDCFLAALDVRPDDYLLYNRIGATIANHGQAREALPYYHRALALNPSYIRARFNLGISCISLQKNDEAAEHILDALVLQENDSVQSEGGRGITSSVLWDTLRTVCIHLHRPDLARLCDRRDLSQFRTTFDSIKSA